MKKRLALGVILFLSIAMNVTLLSIIMGRSTRQHELVVKLVMRQLAALPEDQRVKAEAIVDLAKPSLRRQMLEIKQKRKEVAGYLASKNYQRDEAEKRFFELRAKNSAVQTVAQTLILDIADQLTPEQRAMVIPHQEETLP